MAFELLEQPATIRSVTPRAEKHGEDTVPAVSIGLSITAANTILDKLSATLRKTLYQAPEGQEQLPGVEESTPLLRTRGIQSLAFNGSGEGWSMHIDWGIDEEGSINCGSCKIDKFKVEPMEGGSVDLSFRIGTSDVDADSLGKLSMLLGQEVDVTLTAPKAPEPAIDGSPDGGGPGFQPREPDATDLFAGRDPDAPDDDPDGPADIRRSSEPDPDRTDLPRTVKYRGPSGEQWSGRGNQPRWLKAALATGQRLEDFAVDGVAA